MEVLSLFDGMSCGQIALTELGIKVDNYFASEIDKYAIKIAKKNFPDMIHVGDVTQVKSKRTNTKASEPRMCASSDESTSMNQTPKD